MHPFECKIQVIVSFLASYHKMNRSRYLNLFWFKSTEPVLWETVYIIIIIIILQGRGYRCLFRFRTSELMNLFGHSVGLLGQGISPTQGLCLHRTTKHGKTRTHSHASSEIRTRDPSVRAVEDRPCGHWDRLHMCTLLVIRRQVDVGVILTET